MVLLLCIYTLLFTAQQIEDALQPLLIGGATEDADDEAVDKAVDTAVRSAHDEELWQLACIHLTGMLLQACTPLQEQGAPAVSDPYSSLHLLCLLH
jgi:hypothetical protein